MVAGRRRRESGVPRPARSVAAAKQLAAPAALTSGFQLPGLNAAIPSAIAPIRGRQRTARLARCFLDAGLIPENAPAKLASEPAEACRRYLQAWLDERLGTLQCLELGFRVGHCRYSPFGYRAGAEDHAFFVWFASPQGFVVGPALDRLESMRRGLGSAVLAAISDSFAFAPIFTPAEVLYTTQEHYWHGEDNENALLDEEAGNDPQEREALRAQIVTRQAISDAFPAWALEGRCKTRPLKQRTLRRLARKARSPRVRAVLTAAAELLGLELGNDFRAEGDGWFVGYAGVLMWRPADVAARIFDDFMNDAMQGDSYDAVGETTFRIGAPDEARRWLADMEPYLRAIRCLDRLMHELSTGDWRRVAKGFQ